MMILYFYQSVRWLLIFIINLYCLFTNSFRITMNNMAYFTFDTFFTINNISLLLLHLILFFFHFSTPCHAISVAIRTQAGSSSYISRHIFWKFSNTSPSNNPLFQTYKWWYSPQFFISKIFTLFAFVYSTSEISSMFRWL